MPPRVAGASKRPAEVAGHTGKFHGPFLRACTTAKTSQTPMNTSPTQNQRQSPALPWSLCIANIRTIKTMAKAAKMRFRKMALRELGCLLSEHPKAALPEHLKSGHTFRRNVQDIDSSGRVGSLSRHGECLEGREEATNHSLGTTGMVSAEDPSDHTSSSRDHQRLSARRRCGSMAAGKMETRR